MPDERVVFFSDGPENVRRFSKHWHARPGLPRLWHGLQPFSHVPDHKILKVTVPDEHEGTISQNRRLGDFTSTKPIPAEWIREVDAKKLASTLKGVWEQRLLPAKLPLS